MSIYQLDNIKSKELIPGFFGKMIHTKSMTFAYWDIEEGAEVPRHNHHHEQLLILLEGQMEFYLNDNKIIIEPGMVIDIGSHEYHSGKALKKSVIIDIFNPVREEYK